MIETGEYISPEPMDNHPKALTMTREFYHQCRVDGVPEPRLELLRRYMADTSDFMNPPPPPPMPPDVPVPGAAAGAGRPPDSAWGWSSATSFATSGRTCSPVSAPARRAIIQ